MSVARPLRVLLAFLIAASVCYVLASLLCTAANLIRLAAVGAEFTFTDIGRTALFDLWGMAPTVRTWSQWGSVIFIGLAIALPVAALLRAAGARAGGLAARIVPILYPLAGATAIATALYLGYQRYEVSAVTGARFAGGVLAQCAAGAIAGWLFQYLLYRRRWFVRSAGQRSAANGFGTSFSGGALLAILVAGAGLIAPVRSFAQELDVAVLADGLDAPWGIAVLPDTRLLITERGGAMSILDGSGMRPVANVPPAFVKLQGGLLDVVLDPQFEVNSTLYFSLAYGEQKHNTTRVVRARLNGTTLEDVQVIFDSTPKGTSVHYGGRLAFMRDGTLLLTLGEGAEYREDAQRLSTTLGKVVRIRSDGTPAPDNPFVARRDALPAIWSCGHRNPQGLAVDPASGVVYLTEHGPKGGDEINVIEPGINYGWPIASHGLDYGGGRISPFDTYAGMREPLVFWTPSIAPGGIAVYRGAMFPEWDGDLLVAVLGYTHLRRIDMEGQRVSAQHVLLAERKARLRQVVVGPAGELYVAVDAIGAAPRSGQILRVTRRASS